MHHVRPRASDRAGGDWCLCVLNYAKEKRKTRLFAEFTLQVREYRDRHETVAVYYWKKFHYSSSSIRFLVASPFAKTQTQKYKSNFRKHFIFFFLFASPLAFSHFVSLLQSPAIVPRRDTYIFFNTYYDIMAAVTAVATNISNFASVHSLHHTYCLSGASVSSYLFSAESCTDYGLHFFCCSLIFIAKSKKSHLQLPYAHRAHHIRP